MVGFTSVPSNEIPHNHTKNYMVVSLNRGNILVSYCNLPVSNIDPSGHHWGVTIGVLEIIYGSMYQHG